VERALPDSWTRGLSRAVDGAVTVHQLRVLGVALNDDRSADSFHERRAKAAAEMELMRRKSDLAREGFEESRLSFESIYGAGHDVVSSPLPSLYDSRSRLRGMDDGVNAEAPHYSQYPRDEAYRNYGGRRARAEHELELMRQESALGRMDRGFDAVLDEPLVSFHCPSRPFHDEMELPSARDLDLGARRGDEDSSHTAIIRDWLCRIDVASTFETLDKNGDGFLSQYELRALVSMGTLSESTCDYLFQMVRCAHVCTRASLVSSAVV